MKAETKARWLATLGSWLIRLVLRTLRFRLTDHAGVLREPPEKPLLWIFWHQTLFVMPYMFERFFPGRPGAALTSQSQDGEIISALISKFGIRAIRGSSSRGGARALVAMKRAIDAGLIMAITPDGPRGPRFHLNPGTIKLAQVTGGSVLPIHVQYSRAWQLKSWDGFLIPKPFATVRIVFAPLHFVAPTSTEEEFEKERVKLERILQSSSGELDE